MAKNPCKELSISPAEMKRLKNAFERELKGEGAQLRKAVSLYTGFTGHEKIEIRKISIPDYPQNMIEIGRIDGILYTTVRDGKVERYKHTFKKLSRPLFCVSPDGKQVFMIGGSFTFGDRGIEDI
jgi:hypothetical protein